MGIITDILETLAVGAVKVAIAGGGALARIGARVIAEARPRIAAAVRAVRDDWQRRQADRWETSTSSADVRDELREINDRLARLAMRARGSGLTPDERSQKEKWIYRRGDLLAALQGSDEQRIAESIADDHRSEYDALTISDRTTHLLQSTVGQTLYGKKCPKCGWPMQLQWNRRLEAIGAHDMGWGCTGWYWTRNGVGHRCEHWESLAPQDYDVFARARRPEFSDLTPAQFSGLVLGHSDQVITRMDDVRNDKALRGNVEAYRCPVHGEPMVLRKKNQHLGRLMDMYFLGCPRWKMDGHGCEYMVKLKSPAQLHAYLEASTGEGVI
ncbi:hypothetical protein [Aromatoleum bremense]|uniref:Phage protein n=1 Tax=Aromatoleum bremense TaxID=76115 RepID=A0ABX1NQK3_9RHOO|nr:hypothetical protein [Aromatoleum bremense]NMG14226.1 hypothetical protein [Aromatoleum bremense]QTQ34006.1 Uncharacterized protein pbN1_40230 [Aromatoleum bremense]